MNRQIRFPLEVFYNGSCAVCVAAMNAYRKRVSKNRLRFIDISRRALIPPLMVEIKQNSWERYTFEIAMGCFIPISRGSGPSGRPFHDAPFTV